jgi:hypothetical protein
VARPEDHRHMLFVMFVAIAIKTINCAASL